MNHPTITTTTVAPSRTVGLPAVAASATSEDIGPVIAPLFPAMIEALTAAGVTPAGPSIVYYAPDPEAGEGALRIHAGFPVAVESVAGLQHFDLPGGEYASTIHLGSMDSIDESYQHLNRWVAEQGLTPTGEGREIYLETPGEMADWVTEVQVAFTQ